MANIRLYQFNSKAAPIPADLVYLGDSANAFDEVQSTIEEFIAAYPNLSGIAGLTLSANTYPYSNSSGIITAGSISPLAVTLLGNTTAAAMRSTLGVSNLVWSTVSTTSQAGVTNTGYFANNAALVTISLPSAAAKGDLFSVAGEGAGGWAISQIASQQIIIGSGATTVGAGGSIASTNQYDSINLICVTANLVWMALGAPQGNITIV